MKLLLPMILTLLIIVEPSIATPKLFTVSYCPAAPSTRVDKIFYLDGVQQYELRQSSFLSSEIKQAMIEAKQLIQTESINKHDPQLLNAITGLTKAWALGVEKVPAVVFDDHYVVYGTTDIAFASKKFAEFKAEKER